MSETALPTYPTTLFDGLKAVVLGHREFSPLSCNLLCYSTVHNTSRYCPIFNFRAHLGCFVLALR
jgi:hypothetical protein